MGKNIHNKNKRISRRQFIKGAGALAIAARRCAPMKEGRA